jgi:hypothetical protein
MIAILVALTALAARLQAETWSVFSPLPECVPVPQIAADSAIENPVDAFVLSRLEQHQITPAPMVDRRTWLRRVTYDLIGLPPRPDEVERFVADPRDDVRAYADVVDRLLASPHYGERWARHWLDVVRYADTDGFAIDSERPTLWRYRDYVIRAYNEDLPFDLFLRQQLAGDELQLGVDGLIATSL